MYKFLVFIILLSICVICAHCTNFDNDLIINSTEIESVESRRRKTGHYFLHPYHGWYALSWIYWIKVKLIVVAFFVGTAFVWAIQYAAKFYRPCPSESHIHYGHYRSLEDPVLVKFLKNLK
ncbi:uncharacterized protein ACRADG_009973 [Cochliomyia hominivorax]